jgi:hypothetical protein
VIRINTQEEESRTVVTIDGRFMESDLKELQRVRKSLHGEVVLSLRGLDACADDGIQLLRGWLQAGAQLRDATPFLRMMLETPTA